MSSDEKQPIYVPRTYAAATAVAVIHFAVETDDGVMTLSTWSIGPTFDEAVANWHKLRAFKKYPMLSATCPAHPRNDKSAPAGTEWKNRGFRGPKRNGVEPFAEPALP
jgi:hypothetical protein